MALARKIAHLAIAVKDLDTAVQTFGAHFGFPVTGRSEDPALGGHRARLAIGDAQLELFTPATADTLATQFLAERGEGMYLLALEVDDLDGAIAALAAKGVTVSEARATPDGGRVVFISPTAATHGVPLQLIERPPQSPAAGRR